MTDTARLEQALIAADKAGDTAAATALASEIKKQRGPETEAPKSQEKPGMFERVADAAIKGSPGGPLGMMVGATGVGLDMAAEKIKELGDFAGEKTTDLATKVGASPEVAGGVGAATTTAIQAAPMLMGGGKAKVAQELVPKVEIAVKEAAQRAEQAVKSAGMDWSKLGRQARMRLTELAKDSENMPKLDKAGVERVARGQSLDRPINLTKGQATRDPGQLRIEEQLAQTNEGTAIRERHLDQNEALTENLNVLKGNTGAKAKTAEDVGVTTDKALRQQSRSSMANVDKLYNKARRAGELEATLPTDPIIQAVKENPVAKKMLIEQLHAMDLVKLDRFGQPMPTHDITLNQLERVRRRAATVARTSTDGTMAHDAGELVKAIDAGIPDTAGGEAYRAARASRKEHAMKFEEPKAISQILENKTATDRKVALEDVFQKTVVSKASSVADLERVRDTLLKTTDRESRNAGRKAWKDMAGQTVEYIKSAATNTAVKDQRGNPNLSADGLRKALESIGDRKLEILLGKNTTAKLKAVADSAADVKTMPPYKGGSTTVPNALPLLIRILEKGRRVPYITDVGRGAFGVASDVAKKGAAGRIAQDALGDPATAAARSDSNLTLRKLTAPAAGIEEARSR